VTTGGTTVTRHFTRTPDGQLISQRVGGSSYYYLTDERNSVLELLDINATSVNRYSYTAYGVTTVHQETIPNPFRYISAVQDSQTGLYKLGIRYYDPTLARFTQPDPTGQDAHYVYAANDPVDYVDPDGGFAVLLLPAIPVAAVVAVAAVAAITIVYAQRGGNRQTGNDPLNELSTENLRNAAGQSASKVDAATKAVIKKILKGRDAQRSRKSSNR